MTIKIKFISQNTGICCAMCGFNNKVSNHEYDDETDELISDKTFQIVKYGNNIYLWFQCQYCTNSYRIPFFLEDSTLEDA